jgi:hypothetical protein
MAMGVCVTRDALLALLLQLSEHHFRPDATSVPHPAQYACAVASVGIVGLPGSSTSSMVAVEAL